MSDSFEVVLLQLGVSMQVLDRLKNDPAFAQRVAKLLGMLQRHSLVHVMCVCPVGTHPGDKPLRSNLEFWPYRN